MRVLHLATRADWDAALGTGSYVGSTRGVTLAEEGFVHTATRAQLPGVLERFYADADLAEHVLLVVDLDGCEAAGSAVRWEPPPGTDELFAHVYGPIPVPAVPAALPLHRDADGTAELPDLTGWAVA